MKGILVISNKEKKGKGRLCNLPEKGDAGELDPAGEMGGELYWKPGGFTIIILRVILIGDSEESSPYDLALPPSSSDPKRVY